MALIRQAQAQRIARDAIVLDFGDLAREGEHWKAEARTEAERVLATAQKERDKLLVDAAEKGRAQGMADGHKQGLEQGREQGRAEALAQYRERFERVSSEWERCLGEFLSRRDAILNDARADVVKLAIAIARRVIRKTIDVDPGVAAGEVEAALAATSRRTRVRICVHPEDAAVLEETLPAILTRLRNVEHAVVAHDEGVSRGSCMLSTDNGGVVDASIETQIERIARALLPSCASETAEKAPESSTPGVEP